MQPLADRYEAAPERVRLQQRELLHYRKVNLSLSMVQRKRFEAEYVQAIRLRAAT